MKSFKIAKEKAETYYADNSQKLAVVPKEMQKKLLCEKFKIGRNTAHNIINQNRT